ncbi:nucleoid-associated protein [Clostridia bacterium]|nr:nucleoid-associated protein [Clostridia bacterium]
MKARIPEGVQQQGNGDIGSMVRQAQKMQEKIRKLQDELDEREYSVSAGGGMVELVMLGNRELKTIRINPEVVDRDNVDDLEDIIMAGVNTILNKVEEENASEMEKITGGINLPGLV